jgi:hypothetical protein
MTARAHPEIVGGDGANFGDHQQWADLIAQMFDSENSFDGVFSRDEVFGL